MDSDPISEHLENLGIQNIILAGFMGSGKSTVGRLLAQRLHWTFRDTDKIIEDRARRSVASIFKEIGEPAFRNMETAIARELPQLRHCVIATGGGFLVRPENRTAAMEAGEVILLVASPEEIWHRVGQSEHRPLLQVEDPMSRIRDLLKEREEAYNSIPTQVTTDEREPSVVVEEILERLLAR